MEKSTFKRRLMFVVCMLMCGLSIQAADDGLITDQVIIDKLVAGTLPQRISSDEKYLITNLKINGQINGTDLRLIREMAGLSVKGSDWEPDEETEGKLSILDLSDAKIVSGGDPYYQVYDYMEDRYNNYFTKDNEIGYMTFSNSDVLTSVTLPSGLTSIGKRAFEKCWNLASVTFPSTLVTIGGSAFSECPNLASVTFQSGLTSIGSSAFFACRSLTNVTFPSSLTEIGNNAFNMCGFKTLTLPSGLTKIGKEAFADCIRLKSLTLSPSLTSIGVEAFGGLGNLRTLTIPSGLTSIDSLKKYDDEFEESYLGIFVAPSMESVYVGWQIPIPAGDFFKGCDISKCTLYVPLGTKQAYAETEVWRDYGEIKEYDVSGVDKVDNHSEAKEVSRYSLDGQRLSVPVKGLNIVRYSDGSIKKVVVN